VSIGRILAILVVAALLGLAIQKARDPRRTELPFGTTDLSSVEAALARLDPADRARVGAYVKRSNGDVLPPQFADPDQPFTARTFAEAVALEKAWEVKRAEQEVAAAARETERDAAMAPLREAIEADVVRAEVLSPRQLAEPPDADAAMKQALPSDDATVFAVTVSLHNLTSKTIVGVQGALEARQPDAYLPLQLCWVDVGEREQIEPASRVEVRCGNPARQASDEERAFKDDDSGRFTVSWKPKSVVFSDGTRLDSGP
jgi:hypothetical protein